MFEVSDSMVAEYSETSVRPVLISKLISFDRSLHHSEYSSYVFCASLPSAMILAWRSPIIWRIFSIGLTSSAWAGATASATTASAMETDFIFRYESAQNKRVQALE